MANIETDKLGLIQSVPVKGIMSLFGRTISVADGFSIEVFRSDKHHGSILSKDVALASDVKKTVERLGVRHDDTLYQVNLGAKLFTLEGNFATNDQLQPGYKVVLELSVLNPKQFVMRYRQQDDPVRVAIAALEGELRRYAALRAHDRLRTDDMRYRVEHTLNVGNNRDIGLDVVRVHDVIIFMDPHVQKKREVLQQKDIERTEVVEQIKTDSIKSEASRNEQERDWEAERKQKYLDREEERRQDSLTVEEKRRQEQLDRYIETMTTGLVNRLREKLEAGYTLDEIYSEHPELQGFYPTLLPTNSSGYIPPVERQRLSGSIKAHNPRDTIENDTPPLVYGEAEADTNSPRGTSLHKMDAISIPTLGLTCIPVMLNEEQQRVAEKTNAEAFLIARIDRAGNARNANLLVGDIVVKVNDETISDLQTLADTLRLSINATAQRLSMHILRHEKLIRLSIENPE
jgi:PDZ domain